MQPLSDAVPWQQGIMDKDPRTMSQTERRVWQQQCADNARAYLFSINQPLVYVRADGHTVAEYRDGRIEVVR